MTIRFPCPSGHRLSVPDEDAGTKVRCARCKKIAYVPPESELPPKSGAPPPPLPAKTKPTKSKTKPAKAPPELPRTAAPVSRAEPKPKRRRRKRTRQRRRRQGPPLMAPDTYVPDAGTITTVKWLAFFLGLAVLFSVAPVIYMGQLNIEQSAWWARLVLLLAAIQCVYILWMLSAPDWASVWVVMLVFAGVATLYAVASAMVMSAWDAVSAGDPETIPLGMEEVRRRAGVWCGAVVAVMALATYLCGRVSTKWRRTVELELAGRRRAGQ